MPGFVVKEHHSTLLLELRQQRKSPDAKNFCNVTLILQDKRLIHAHKCVLASQSNYFERLINDFYWMDRLEVELDITKPALAIALIDSFYNGVIDLDTDEFDFPELDQAIQNLHLKYIDRVQIRKYYDENIYPSRFRRHSDSECGLKTATRVKQSNLPEVSVLGNLENENGTSGSVSHAHTNLPDLGSKSTKTSSGKGSGDINKESGGSGEAGQLGSKSISTRGSSNSIKQNVPDLPQHHNQAHQFTAIPASSPLATHCDQNQATHTPTRLETKSSPLASAPTAHTNDATRHAEMAPNISNSIFQKLSKYIETSNIFTGDQQSMENGHTDTSHEGMLLDKVGVTLEELQQTKIKAQTHLSLDHLTPEERHEFQKIRRRERSKFTAKAYRSNRKKKYESDQEELKQLKERNENLVVDVKELMRDLSDKVKLAGANGGVLSESQQLVLSDAANLSNELHCYLSKLQQKAEVESQQAIKQQAMSDHDEGADTDPTEQQFLND